MSKYNLLGIFREKRFSPGMVEKDAAVLRGVLERLQNVHVPLKIDFVDGENLCNIHMRPDFVLTMAQSEESLERLNSWGSSVSVINSISGVKNCYRTLMVKKLVQAGINFPESLVFPVNDLISPECTPMAYPFWIKRGDVHAMAAGDVMLVRTRDEFVEALKHFEQEQVKTLVCQKHVEGEVLKFYGVRGNGFFRVYSEIREGIKEASLVRDLKVIAMSAAEALELEIFGGDVVWGDDDNFHVIDMNDWPSFSACTGEASEAISKYIINKWQLV